MEIRKCSSFHLLLAYIYICNLQQNNKSFHRKNQIILYNILCDAVRGVPREWMYDALSNCLLSIYFIIMFNVLVLRHNPEAYVYWNQQTHSSYDANEFQHLTFIRAAKHKRHNNYFVEAMCFVTISILHPLSDNIVTGTTCLYY